METIVVQTTGRPACEQGRLVYRPEARDAPDAVWAIESDPERGVHYVIGPGGEVETSIPEDRVARHVSGARGSRSLDELSLAVALVNRGDGSEPFPEAQLVQLALLVDELRSRHGIPLGQVRARGELEAAAGARPRLRCAGDAPGPGDPGLRFDWDAFLARLRLLDAG